MRDSDGPKLYLGFGTLLVALVIGGIVVFSRDRNDVDAASESSTDAAIAELRAETHDLQRETESLKHEIESLAGGDAEGAAEHGAAVPAADHAAPADGHSADAGDDDGAAPDHAGPPHWTYDGAADGPAAWGTLSGDFTSCASGEQQSPINISSTVRTGLTDAVFRYGPSPRSCRATTPPTATAAP